MEACYHAVLRTSRLCARLKKLKGVDGKTLGVEQKAGSHGSPEHMIRHAIEG